MRRWAFWRNWWQPTFQEARSFLEGLTPPPSCRAPSTAGWPRIRTQRLLLVVDQVEELVTLCRDDATRAAFLQTLADLLAAHPDRVRVILTLRTDFEPQFQDSPLRMACGGQVASLSRP